MLNRLLPAVWWLGLAATAPLTAAEQSVPDVIRFNRDVRPLFAGTCYNCHGQDEKARKSRLRLDTREGALHRKKGGPVIVPGKPHESELFRRVTSTEPTERMPPIKTGKALSIRDIAVLKKWIEQGAKWEEHWSFVAPRNPLLPPVRDSSWGRNEIDAFLLGRLEAEGLKPAAEADRYSLARRVAIDLTGLPATIEEADRFVNDRGPQAYERYVDRLLQSPGFGERWAQVWLDLARYADSKGYTDDGPRTIWRYRDWVVRALNANMPFDQFTIEQIAGDLLPKATEQQILATAFHRNTLSNDEGGTNDEEFRVAAVVDRVNTTFQVWMGVTMACAQCHDHKYDPFTQEEYFKVFAILNNTEDADRNDEAPTMEMWAPGQKEKFTALQSQIAEVEKQLKALAKNPVEQKKAQERLAALRRDLAAVQPMRTPIMRELPKDRRRKTHLFFRGNFLDTGKQVAEGVPATFPPLPPGQAVDRLALARWLVDAKNPLTARVTVNRLWEQLFGTGLVETSEDFGLRGTMPLHPELLDWLAVRLIEDKWDLKKTIRRMVTSSAYRQSSRVTPALLERDPHNRLLAHGPRVRGTAEAVRDQALFVSGLLSRKMYGPPVRPPQPREGLNAAFGGSIDWTTSDGEDKYRRGLYTQWRRTRPYPSMATFDAPSRNVCTVRRPSTNTPLQALTTLNDPVYVEAAQALARRVLREGGATTEARTKYGFRLCLTRPPSEREQGRLVALYEKAHERYRKDAKQAEQLAGAVPSGVDRAEAAAWTVVGNVLLNLDEMFAKR
ncbi:MAG: PSD1 domain-containing protein [Planctomycetes bacterium]|nr:PSD1 domain-containing protein [Planctomycetota bacterium]